MRLMKALLTTLVMITPVVASAQSADATNDAPVADREAGTPDKTAAPTPTGQLPPATSDHDPAPPVPTPAIPGINGDVVEQAGVGGTVGYGRAGVLELGGSAGLTLAQDIRALNFSPSVGWFLVDNFELSAILDVTNIKAGNESATLWSALVEPSFHLPFNRGMFGFVGMGIGAAYQSDLGAGLAVAPRIGMDFLVGRSGILRPSLSYEYTTHDSMAAVGAGRHRERDARRDLERAALQHRLLDDVVSRIDFCRVRLEAAGATRRFLFRALAAPRHADAGHDANAIGHGEHAEQKIHLERARRRIVLVRVDVPAKAHADEPVGRIRIPNIESLTMPRPPPTSPSTNICIE